MSPAGGPASRFLRGHDNLPEHLIDVTCSCGRQYQIDADALDIAECPVCHKPVRDLPTP